LDDPPGGHSNGGCLLSKKMVSFQGITGKKTKMARMKENRGNET
jgi:hypothetical protein